MVFAVGRYNQHLPKGLLEFARFVRRIRPPCLEKDYGTYAIWFHWMYLLDKELCPHCGAHIKNYEEALGEHNCGTK